MERGLAWWKSKPGSAERDFVKRFLPWIPAVIKSQKQADLLLTSLGPEIANRRHTYTVWWVKLQGKEKAILVQVGLRLRVPSSQFFWRDNSEVIWACPRSWLHCRVGLVFSVSNFVCVECLKFDNSNLTSNITNQIICWFSENDHFEKADQWYIMGPEHRM